MKSRVETRKAGGFTFWLGALICASNIMAEVPLVVDTSVRRASRNFYNGVYLASEGISPAWTGNVANGIAGDTSSPFKAAMALRINSFRAFAGTPAAVTFSPVWNAKAQKAALMMSANNQLDHTPPPSWTFYSSDGAEAAGNSNIYLGTFGPEAITGYIDDSGTNNDLVGHRRWLLYPPTQQMGTGDIPASPGFQSANAVWIFDLPRPYPAVRDGFVAWPPKGYVPYQLIFPRWSFSLKGADFNGARISVQRDGLDAFPVVESSTNIYGDNTIVWHLTNIIEVPDDVPKDTIYSVTVANVLVDGLRKDFSYTVIGFNPRWPAADDIRPNLGTTSGITAGKTKSFPFTPLPEATGYDLWSARLIIANWVEGAESSTFRLQPKITGNYAWNHSGISASGSRSFHLCQEGFNDQSLVLTSQFVAATNSSISFKSRYGYMTPTQIAAVEVSLDDGRSWERVFARAGNDAENTSFLTQSVNLSAFADLLIRLRFLLDYKDGSAYPQTGANVGWFIDDITPVNLPEAVTPVIVPFSEPPAVFTAPMFSGKIGVAVRAKLFGDFPLEYGPVRTLTINQPAPSPTPIPTPTPTPTLPPTPSITPSPTPTPTLAPGPTAVVRKISLSAAPAEFGAASGNGTFALGSTCTVRAVPKKRRSFHNWTEGGKIVSTSASYTFVITKKRNLTANFK